MEILQKQYDCAFRYFFSARKGCIEKDAGNRTATLIAQKVPTYNGGAITGYKAQILQSIDYSPFGVTRLSYAVTPVRASHPVEEGYRWGFQGQEKDDEVKGEGNSINYKYRMHDPRLGRFFAVDLLFKEFPWNNNYAFSENRVIDGFELEGLEHQSYTIKLLEQEEALQKSEQQ